jgi:hypothetical protein
MLTRTVVLFDEFDSILRTRSLDRDRPVSEFSFLTPGLLPKLKRLHDKAAKQQVAFALATNFVGDLDSAAIRSGRFDAKLGIFPPDFLARVGRLATEMRRHKSNPPADEHRWDRAIAIIDACAGYGMATLGKPGWFTKPGKNKSYSGMPFGHIFDSETSPALGEKESERPEYPPPAGTADVGFQEWREWAVIADLDSRGKAIEPEKGAKDRWRSYLGKIEGVWVARAQELHDTEKNDANAWKARAARATEPPQGR